MQLRKITFVTALLVIAAWSEPGAVQATVQISGSKKAPEMDPLRQFLQELETGKAQIKYDLFHHAKTKRKLYRYEPKKKKYYVVKSGDNLTHIARRFKLTVRKLMRMNNIKKKNRIYIGQRLVVARGKSKKRVVSTFRPKKALNSKHYRQNLKFKWPLKGKRSITRRFRKSRQKPSLGIVIAGRRNDSVLSSADGKIVRVGRMRGYGRYVIVAHADHFLTVYSGLTRINVKHGQTIKAGHKLGALTAKGRNRLHFQVGYYGRPVNPLRYVSRPV